MQQTSNENSIRYYGWAVAGSLAITELTSWGILFYSFSVMVTPMRADLGWSAGTVTGAFAGAFLISGISAIVVGRLVDRYGSRVVMSSGSCLGAVLLLLWSRVTNPVEFYLIWAGLGVASAMLFYEPAFAATTSWFTTLRRHALTIVTVGGALASVVFVPVAAWLVLQLGWRGAVFALAVIPATTTGTISAIGCCVQAPSGRADPAASRLLADLRGICLLGVYLGGDGHLFDPLSHQSPLRGCVCRSYCWRDGR